MNKNITKLTVLLSKDFKDFKDVDNFQDNHLITTNYQPYSYYTSLYPDINDITYVKNIYYYNDLKIPPEILNLNFYNNLKKLCCKFNYLDTLLLSNCVNLEDLDCHGNVLTLLDISDCSQLKTLNCSHNKLTSLDLSCNLLLTNLDCGINKLTSLDISCNSLLTKVYCNNNILTTLLLNTYIEHLFCVSNSIENLNISLCTNLHVLYCDYNRLKLLDISYNKNLIELYCSHNFIETIVGKLPYNLEKLHCHSNYLTTLNDYYDVNDNFPYNLRQLRCCSNRLTTLNVSLYKNLTMLSCSNNRLTSLNVDGCNNLTMLYCYCNLLTELPLSMYQLRNLTDFVYCDNFIDFTYEQLLLLVRLKYEDPKKLFNITNDAQNIHDLYITASVKESFDNILANTNYQKCDSVLQHVINDNRLSDYTKNKLLEYCQDTVPHSLLKVTFLQALQYLYPLHTSDSIKILENEILDSDGKCSTGKIFRLINSLNGIIPEVVINISLNQDLNNIASFISTTDNDNKDLLFIDIVKSKYPELNNDYLELWIQDLKNI